MKRQKKGRMLAVATLLIASTGLLGYEDLTHQQLAKRAVQVAAANASGIPTDLVGQFVDAQGRIKDLGQKVINGAGRTPLKWRDSEHTIPDDSEAGEDYTNYGIGECWAVGKWPDFGEPANHFANGDLDGSKAYVRFLHFRRDAVLLWRHNKKAEAAFILGRAIHLVEDMAPPQHAIGEWHYPYRHFYHLPSRPIYNPSYLEAFVESHIEGPDGKRTTSVDQLCEFNYGQTQYPDYTPLIAGLSAYGCNGCMTYRDYFGNAIEVSVDTAYAGPEPGPAILKRAFTSEKLEAWFNPDPQYPMFTPLPSSIYLPFQFVGVGCDVKTYKQSAVARKPDYWKDGPSNGKVRSIDFGFRLAEAELGADAFVSWHTDALLKPAVADAAGVIVAFWSEVKGSCGSSSAKESSGTCLVCLTDRPSGENPDDSVAVKASSRTESGSVPASDDWHDVCRVGIGKGLASMADYGISWSLIEQLAYLDPNTDPSVAQALYDRLEALEGKYSGPQNLMPQVVEKAPNVAVWMKGFGGSARSLVEAMREPVTILEEAQEPVFTDEEALSLMPPKRGLLDADPAKQKVLVLPTGSLYGLRADSVEAQALQGFVQQGGIVVSFTQPYGDDFSALPVPAGQALQAAGFKQDLSCFADSAYPTMEHAILSGITGTTVTAGFDGYFRTIPENAAVLLRRTISGEPCLILYPVGQGYVVASTMYEDWGYANGQSTVDGRSILANILAWAKSPNQAIPVTNLSSGGSASGIAVTLHVRNLSDTPADQMEVLVMTPDRQTVAAQASVSGYLTRHNEGG